MLGARSIKMTSLMTGDAVQSHRVVAAKIVRRGHEAEADGRGW